MYINERTCVMLLRTSSKMVQHAAEVIVRLNERLDLVPKLAAIYRCEWGWHYAAEWDVHTQEQMEADIRENYVDSTWVAVDRSNGGRLVGTVALLEADLKSHVHLAPWVTCLYVVPERRGEGLGRRLFDHAVRDAMSRSMPCYLWCYGDREQALYQRWGFELLEDVTYIDHDGPRAAHVMSNYAKGRIWT